VNLYELIRDKDVSGVSGTGPVAEMVEFSNGWVAVAFYEYTAGVPNVIVYGSLADAVKIHGHGGLTHAEPRASPDGFAGIDSWSPAPLPGS
jgi:hypothetical protein